MSKIIIIINIILISIFTSCKTKQVTINKSKKDIVSSNLYTIEGKTDCESEGFIRFRDKNTDKVGMLNKDKTIAIPAEYNELSKVHNGLVWALKGAKKKFNNNHSGCNHYSWENGTELLLNTKNEVLIENFHYKDVLNLYSLKISTKKNNHPNRKNFKGLDNKFYSFIDYKKEFKNWLKEDLLNSITLDKLNDISFDNITYWKEPKGWTSEPKAIFLKRNFKLIKARLTELNEIKTDYNYYMYKLEPILYKGEKFSKYLNSCGEAISQKYPTMTLTIEDKNKPDLEDNFEFIRTDKGYKLIGLSIKNNN